MLVNPELLRAFAAQVSTASAAIRSADVGHKTTTAADGIPGSTTQWAMRVVGEHMTQKANDIAKNINLSFVVDNLFDAKPRVDPTWTSYPYYYIPWNNPIGRSFFLEANMKLGGSHSE